MGFIEKNRADLTVRLTHSCPPAPAQRVRETMALGSHTMFLADVLAVHADEAYMDDKKKFDLSKADPIVYSHGEYRGIGKCLGNFGFSVRKKKGKSAKRGGSEKRSDAGNSDGRKR